jgi:hypothetical protein
MSRVVVNEIEAKVGNDITFNDTVKIDTIKGKTTAGSVTVQGEGTATTNLQQGIAKCWFQIIQNTTHTIQDSFNVGSIVDAGAGETTVNFSNVMANSDWSGVLTAQSANNRRAMNNAPNTIRIKVEVYQVSTNSNPADATGGVSGTIHGDLA